MSKIGDRVGAIYGTADDGVIEFLGYGEYVGDEIPEDAVGWMADLMKEVKRTNPKILLDSGEIVWGCECWWGSESKVKKQISHYKDNSKEVVTVSISDVRKRFLNKEPTSETS